ncbi:MAG: 30S ribosomal protein S20 [Verrucomicrobium sp.]|nr:30S ribosomal protein S20 [Verrucomicrobium sp.]
MANIRSAAKQARKATRRRSLNRQAHDLIRQAAKKIKNLVKEGKQDEAKGLLSDYQSQVDRAAKVGRLKGNTASRRKSRLARLFSPKKEAAAPAPAAPKKAAAKKPAAKKKLAPKKK